MIIRRGKRLRAEAKAMTIANAVKRPNKIVGIKLDKDKMENPIVIVKDV